VKRVDRIRKFQEKKAEITVGELNRRGVPAPFAIITVLDHAKHDGQHS
jgi:hypothetical protein